MEDVFDKNGSTTQAECQRNGKLAKVIQVNSDNTTRDMESYEYDKAGNITKKTLQGQVTSLTYNAANELTSTSSGGGTTTNTYDKAGLLPTCQWTICSPDGSQSWRLAWRHYNWNRIWCRWIRNLSN